LRKRAHSGVWKREITFKLGSRVALAPREAGAPSDHELGDEASGALAARLSSLDRFGAWRFQSRHDQ
jgi:hypothetical protein